MLRKIKEYVKEHKMLEKEDRIVIGVSGGADSVCLLFVLLDLQKEMGFYMEAVHVNHGLRGEEADADQEFVRDLCDKLGITFTAYFENVELLAKKWKQSTEEAGRNFRKECFEERLKNCQGNKIALAHHKNDNAETFLMNLARGSGLKGLGGIYPVQGKVIRPLLCVEREEIERYLEENHISFCIDETNAENAYTRNRIRNQLIPIMEKEVNIKTVAHMDDTMRYIREINDYLEEQAAVFWKECVFRRNDGYLLLQDKFVQVPEVLKPLLLRRLLASAAEHEKDLESIHISMLGELLGKQVGRRVDLPYNLEGKRVYEGVLLGKKKPEKSDIMPEIVFSPEELHYTLGRYQISCRIVKREELENNMEKSGEKWFDYDIIKNGVSFRSRRAGDYITIDANGRIQKLKAYFINEKIPQEKRDDILLVADGSHVLCVWGYRLNCAYQVTEHTENILVMKVDEGEESWQNKSKC